MSTGRPPDPGPVEPTQEQLALLVELSRKINSKLDVDTILNNVIEFSLILTRAERGFLFLADGTDHLKVRVALDDGGRDILGEPVRVSSGVVSAMLAHGIPIFLEDVKLNDQFARRRSIMEAGVQFIMGIPLKVKGRILGFIYVDNTKSSRKFLKRDRQILTSFADQAALALENARLSREKSEVEQDAALGQMSERLLTAARACIMKLDECRDILSSGWDDASRVEVEKLLARTGRQLERRVLEFEELRDFMDDRIQVRLEPALLDGIVKTVLDDLGPVLEDGAIQLHVSLNIGRSSMMDAGRMRRVLEAILLNAIEALAEVREPVIAVTTAPVPEGLLVEVRDNGAGIRTQDIDRLFEPFFGSGKKGGLGLGLSIAKRIVELHRGHIEVRSREGGSTSVWVVLPSDLRPSLVPRARKSSSPPPPSNL